MKLSIILLLVLTACASSGRYVSNEQPPVSILTVENQRAEELTIYVMHAGYKGRRLGQVTGLASATFVLSEWDAPPAADVQFLAMAFGSGASELSDPIVATRGASYQWKLNPGHGQQFAYQVPRRS
jgi:hypothetical protein